jgi:hypothetical protein
VLNKVHISSCGRSGRGAELMRDVSTLRNYLPARI